MHNMDVKTPIVDYPLQPLYELPNVDEPVQSGVKQDSSCLALIPVFRQVYSRSANTLAYIKSAIYSRKLCLENTDAVSEGVAVKLYIERELENIVIPILEANAIDLDEDIIWFATPPLEKSRQGRWGRYSKKMVSYWDHYFKDYEWIVCSDADLFWVADGKFFEKLKAYPKKQIGYIRKSFTHNWKKRLEISTSKGGIPVEQLLEMAHVPKEIQQHGELESVVGYLWCYPAKHFHQNHNDFIQWMWNYAPYLGDDEICVLLYQKLFGLELFDIRKTFDINTQKTYDYIKKPKNTCHLIHGRPKPEPEQINAFRKIVGVT